MRPLCVNSTCAAVAVRVHAVTVRALLDPIRVAVVPTSDAFIQVLLGEVKLEGAAARPAQVDQTGAIDRGGLALAVFVSKVGEPHTRHRVGCDALTRLLERL